MGSSQDTFGVFLNAVGQLAEAKGIPSDITKKIVDVATKLAHHGDALSVKDLKAEVALPVSELMTVVEKGTVSGFFGRQEVGGEPGISLTTYGKAFVD